MSLGQSIGRVNALKKALVLSTTLVCTVLVLMTIFAAAGTDAHKLGHHMTCMPVEAMTRF